MASHLKKPIELLLLDKRILTAAERGSLLSRVGRAAQWWSIFVGCLAVTGSGTRSVQPITERETCFAVFAHPRSEGTDACGPAAPSRRAAQQVLLIFRQRTAEALVRACSPAQCSRRCLLGQRFRSQRVRSCYSSVTNGRSNPSGSQTHAAQP